MHLHLSLPPAGERTADPFTLDSVEAAGAWLAELPQDDHRKTAKQLLDMLVRMNRTRIRVTLRQDVTELFLQRAREILPRLSDALTDGMVPITGSSRSAAGLAEELLTELCYSYKLLLMEQSRRLFGFASSGRALMPVIRAMQLLSNRLTLGYRMYSSSAKTVWLELHELYQFSARRGFSQRHLDDEIRTPLCIYRDALLLAFAEPLKLMPGDVDRLVAWIAVFGELAALGPSDTRRAGSGLYLVKSQRDVAGYALSKRQHPPIQTHDLILNTAPAAEAMLDQLAKLQTGATPQSLQLPIVAEQPAFHDLLARLGKHWSAGANRRHTRLRTHARVELCIGIRGIWEFLHRDKSHCSADWMVTNESTRGFALTHMGGKVEPISVGEVVGLRTADSSTCHVCIVRWVMSDNPEHIELGLEELASSARAISLRKIGEGADLNPEPVLLLPEVASMSQSPAILAPLLSLDTTCELNLGDLQSKLRVKATRLLERTSSMQLLQFSAVSS